MHFIKLPALLLFTLIFKSSSPSSPTSSSSSSLFPWEYLAKDKVKQIMNKIFFKFIVLWFLRLNSNYFLGRNWITRFYQKRTFPFHYDFAILYVYLDLHFWILHFYPLAQVKYTVNKYGKIVCVQFSTNIMPKYLHS